MIPCLMCGPKFYYLHRIRVFYSGLQTVVRQTCYEGFKQWELRPLG